MLYLKTALWEETQTCCYDISPTCWAIHRSFEIILEMGSVHWIKLQIQCYIQIQKHSVRYELCFKKHLIA